MAGLRVGAGGRLVIVRRDGSSGPSYPVSRGRVEVGSAKECAVRVALRGFPRRQLALEVGELGAEAINLCERAPTEVRGAPLPADARRRLRHGDELAFGQFKFRWEYDRDPSPTRRVAVVHPQCPRNNRVRKLEDPVVLDKIKRAALMSIHKEKLANGRSAVAGPSRPSAKSLTAIKTRPSRRSIRAVRSETKSRHTKIPIRKLLNGSDTKENRTIESNETRSRNGRRVLQNAETFDVSGVKALADDEPFVDKTQTPMIQNKNATFTKSGRRAPENENENCEKLVSFISTLANAFTVLNDSNPVIVENVIKTPEFKALNEKMKLAGKSFDFSIVDSPRLLEIGVQKMPENDTTGLHRPTCSPVISQTDEAHELSDTDIVGTPNLSKVFAVEASTPMESRLSVRERIRKFEASDGDAAAVRRMSTRRSSGIVGRSIQERKAHFEFFDKNSRTEPRKKLTGVVKAKDRRSLPTRSRKVEDDVAKTVADDSSEEIVITPKSTVKPAPEILKEKHSTAKKPVSKRTMIDHLTESPDVVKELFKSPIKRKLSHSIRHYDSIRTFDDSNDETLFNDDTVQEDRASRSLRKSMKADNVKIRKSVQSLFESSELQNSSFDDSGITTLAKAENDNEKSLIIKTVGSPKNDTNDIGGMRKSIRTLRVVVSPKNDLNDVRGVKKLMRTPRVVVSPKNDLNDVRGVKKLMRTPRVVMSPKNDLNDVRGVKKLMKTPRTLRSPKNDLRDVRGVKKLMKSPRIVKSPKNDLSDVRGVKKLMKSPRIVKSPKNDLSDVRGVKKLMESPRIVKSPKNDLSDVRGVKKLMESPRVMKSPKNDLNNVEGLKRLLKTPRNVKSPKNDLRDVKGVKRLLRSPKPIESPENDLSNVRGVKRLMRTPRVVKSPRNDLSNVQGVKKLLRTPRTAKSPRNDLSDVQGVRKLLRTPKIVKSPSNDSSRFEGVAQLLKTPKPKNDLLNVEELDDSFDALEMKNSKNKIPSTGSPKSVRFLDSSIKTPRTSKGCEELFDSFIGVVSPRTYANVKKEKSILKIRSVQDKDVLPVVDLPTTRSKRRAAVDQTELSSRVNEKSANTKNRSTQKKQQIVAADDQSNTSTLDSNLSIDNKPKRGRSLKTTEKKTSSDAKPVLRTTRAKNSASVMTSETTTDKNASGKTKKRVSFSMDINSEEKKGSKKTTNTRLTRSKVKTEGISTETVTQSETVSSKIRPKTRSAKIAPPIDKPPLRDRQRK